MAHSRVVHLVVCALLMMLGGATASAVPTPVVRVTANGETLRLSGAEWWPAGINAPQLVTRYSINDGCGSEVALDQFFASTPPNGLVRFNLFQHLVLNRTSKTFDFSAADAVFLAAEKANRLILPVLAPQDGVCDDSAFKQRAWYVNGWRNVVPSSGELVSFADWVSMAIKRYRTSPAVAGWELVGEPEPSVCLDLACRQRSCPSDAATVLRTFTDRAGAIVRATDPRRMIFAGFLGGDQCGTKGADYLKVSESRNLDVLSYHDYLDPNAVLPGGSTSGLAARLQQAKTAGKPLLVSEIGALAGSCKSLEDRRAALAMKMSGQRKAGTAGGLLWAFVPDPRLADCTYDVGFADPLFAEIATQTQYPYRRS